MNKNAEPTVVKIGRGNFRKHVLCRFSRFRISKGSRGPKRTYSPRHPLVQKGLRKPQPILTSMARLFGMMRARGE